MKWVGLALFAVLPLQWFALGSTPFGQGRLHQLAILFFAFIILTRYRQRAYRPILLTATVFIVANIYMLTTWFAMDLYHGSIPRGSIEQFLYLGAFVAIGTYFARVASGLEPGTVELFRWMALVVCVVLVVAFSFSMAVNGVNPAAVFGKTIATADPEVFQKEVFKTSFAGFGLADDAVAGNLRHEIFGSVLLSMLVTTWAMRFGPPVTKAQRIGYRIAMLLGSLLLLISLSRSVLIAAMLWPVLAFLKVVMTGGMTTRQVALTLASFAAAGMLAVTGFASVIWNRFTTDTTGYDTRSAHYEGAFSELRDHWVTGGVSTAGQSSHNFILDNWLRGGIFTAMAAASILVLLVVTWFSLVGKLPTQPVWMLPIAAALALPIVRLGTAGGGLIAPIEWVVLAFVAGVLTAQRRKLIDLKAQPPVGERERLDFAQ